MSSFELGWEVERFRVINITGCQMEDGLGWGPERRQGDLAEASLGQLRLWEEETLVHSQ